MEVNNNMSKTKVFFPQWTWTAEYDFLEEGKKDEDLEQIAKKHGIVTPCRDIALFRCRYAMVDEANKNSCILPEEDVEKALPTLTGKAIDISHLRKRTIGFWLEGHLNSVGKKKEIISYGAYWKGNFPEEYKELKERMKEGKVKISFEAYGTREKNEDGTYNLKSLEFSGGAILERDVEPACSNAEVLEMSYKDGQILEFAKAMEAKEENKVVIECSNCKEKIEWAKLPECKMGYVKCPKCSWQVDQTGKAFEASVELPESARYYVWDMESIMKALSSVECPSCKEKGMYRVDMIDFVANEARIKCVCDAILKADLTPAVKVQKKGREIKTISEVKKASVEKNWPELIENSEDSIDTIEESFMNEVEYQDSKDIEKSRYESYDMDIISKLVREAERPKEIDNSDYPVIENVDFKNQKVRIRYEPSNTVVEIDLHIKPKTKKIENAEEISKKLTYKERQAIPDNMFAVIKEVKNKKTGELRKIRMFPIQDPAHLRAALSRLGQDKVQTTLKSLGVSIDTVKQKILKRAKELNMKDLLEKYEKSTVEEQAKLFKETIEEVAKLKTDVIAKDTVVATKDTEIVSLKDSVTAKDAEIAALKTDLDKAKKDTETATAEIARRDKEIKDAEIAKRKTELGDIAKDMSDEDVMNEDKYQIAKLKKENADLKAKIPASDPAKGSAEKKEDADLDKGSKDKNKDTAIFATQKKVTERAFGKQENK